MKFTPSSSVSSSTTNTTNSFSENFCRSKGSNFGCISGFLSRILCSKTLPTYPSDPIESEKQQHFLKIVDGSTTPNVVAKLMGLDSMPEFHSRIPQKVSDSIKRTKPRKSEGLGEETGDLQGQEHHRAKTSFSFKETPDFFELEDDDFFLPSKKKKKKGVKCGNSEMGVKGIKQRGRREKCGRKQSRNRDEQGKEKVFSIEDRLSLKISAQNSQKFDNNVGVRNQSYHLSPMKEKPTSRKEKTDDGIKARKKKKKESCLVDSKEEARECDSENLSPVSVLDHSEFSSDAEAATSEEDVKLRRSNPGRDIPCDENNGSSMRDDERERERNGGERIIRKREWRKHEKVEMVSRVYRLAEREIANNNSKWKYRGMLLGTEELEDATTQFGQLIFDQLVTELVHQLLVESQDF